MALITDYQDKLVFKNVTITDAENTTPAAGVDLQGMTLVGIITPSTFDGTTITFTACDTQGGTYLPIYDKTGTAYSVTTAASRYTIIPPADTASWRFVKPVTGTNQDTTDTVLVFVLAPVLIEK